MLFVEHLILLGDVVAMFFSFLVELSKRTKTRSKYHKQVFHEIYIKV